MNKGIAIGVMILLAAPPAFGAEADEQDAKQEKKICRVDKMTGSLTRRTRICRTEAEWRALNDRTRKGLEEMGQSGSGAQSCSYEDPSRTSPCY